MVNRVFIGLAIILLSATRSEAANVAAVVTPPGLFSLVILLIACGCTVLGFKVLSAVRGGLLSKSWRFMVAGFVSLVLAQLTILLRDMEILNLPGWVAPGLLVVMIAALFAGLLHTKRVLG